jgi:hypothetical protein
LTTTAGLVNFLDHCRKYVFNILGIVVAKLCWAISMQFTNGEGARIFRPLRSVFRRLDRNRTPLTFFS